MKKTARILFILVGCVFPIFVGTLHTYVHFRDLVTPELNQFLQKEFMISGELQPVWGAWGILSFMMGASFIIIGLLNISMLLKTSKTDSVPILSILTMILYLICVVYVGIEFESGMQLYGGIFGLMMASTCLIMTILSQRNKKEALTR